MLEMFKKKDKKPKTDAQSSTSAGGA